MKPLLCALALLILSAPLRAQTDAPAPKTDAPQAVTLDNGLIVTSLAVPYGDLQQMADAEIWRFNIKPTAPNTYFQAQLELRTTGQDTQKLNAFGITLAPENELTFGILPKGGSTFQNAEMWRVYFRMRDLATEHNWSPFKADRPNPIQNLIWTTGTGSNPDGNKPLPNGDVPLLSYKGGTKEKPVVTALVLVLTIK